MIHEQTNPLGVAQLPDVSHLSAGRTIMNEVIIKDIQMPFWSMVVFMIKWAFAAIPAVIIVSFVLGILFAMLGGIFGVR